MYDGIINIYKERGFTSHDVVAKMRGICGQRRIGHTGTLDPEATGVLPVCLGRATRLCDMLTDTDKEYVAELLLGVSTDTQDAFGALRERRRVEADGEQIRDAVLSFLGGYRQIPPMYSALKVEGKKLYELAREGREVERQARPVVIHELEILDCRRGGEPPRPVFMWGEDMALLKLRVVCSKGTYIRTLCADIGEKLGCGGIMQSLERTRAGRFVKEDAVTLAQLEQLRDQGRMEEKLWPLERAFEDCPALTVDEAFLKLPENGNPFAPGQTKEKRVYPEGKWVRVYGGGRFFGVYAYQGEKEKYRPVKMFL